MKLAEDLLMHMQKTKSDFTNTFRALGTAAINTIPIYQDAGFQQWLKDWQARLQRQPQDSAMVLQLMQASNPAVIPRNHLVEEALDAAVDANDMAPLQALLSALSHPFDTKPLAEKFTTVPSLDKHYKTFCGT